MAAPTGSTVSRIFRRLAEMYLTRLPFLSAVIFAMLCSERERAEKPETLPRQLIYLQFAVQFLSATMMTWGSQRPFFALVCAIQTAVTCAVIHTSSAVYLQQWITMRMMSRDAAVIGAFLIIASRVHEKHPRRYRLAHLYPLGCSLVGLFCAGYSVQLFRDKNEMVAFLTHMPLATVLQPIYCFYFICAGLVLGSDNRNYMPRAAKGLILLLILVLIFVESDFTYWTKRGMLEFWNHVDQILKLGAAVCSLILIGL